MRGYLVSHLSCLSLSHGHYCEPPVSPDPVIGAEPINTGLAQRRQKVLAPRLGYRY